jgi:aldose 1-epimerase
LTQRIVLNHGAARCLVLPELGGSLGGWWIADQAMLRSADEAAIASGDPTRLSGFPLVPYSNRIAEARFDWRGRQIELAANRNDEAHALHGLGWQRAWQVEERTAASALLRLDHSGDAFWPWPLRAEQRITLTEERLTLDLSATNLADELVPLAIGFHPYFPREGARVILQAEAVWLADAGNLPETVMAPSGLLDLSDGAEIAAREIDNCYTGVCWPVRISWPDRALGIAASANLPCAVVYANAAADALCVEPVAHLSNALGRPDGAMPAIAPGEHFAAQIELSVSG